MNDDQNLINRLRLVLRLNSASCILCGLAMAIWPAGIAAFLGDASPRLLFVIGLILTFHGLHLIFASRRQTLIFFEVVYFALGDYGWVIATIILIVAKLGITTIPGTVLSLAIAAMVGTFGVLQTRIAISARQKGLIGNTPT